MTTQIASNKELFAADLFTQISKSKSQENVIISPISVQTALAITYIGAEGQTAIELQSGLRLLVTDAEQVGRHFAGILRQNNGEAKLSIANRMFVKTEYQIAPFFQEIVSKYFDSGAEQLDFSQSSKAINVINQWVAEKTNKKITNIMQPGSVDSETKAIIVNAIYFKGKWKTPFSKDMTRKSNFWISETKSVKVDTIYGSEHFKYGEFPELNATAVEMPYKDSDISMILILPKERDGLASLEAKLSSVAIHDLSSRMTVKSLDLYMPKFKIEFKTRLTDVLKAMGIRSLFENANLPGIFGTSGPPIKVSDVHHMAFIDVNEAGSEASAATSFSMIVMSCLIEMGTTRSTNLLWPGLIKSVKTTTFNVVLCVIVTIASSANINPSSSTSMSGGLFAADLLGQIAKSRPTENVVFSPLSIQTALAMAYLGAGGNTAEELKNGLRLTSSDKDQIGEQFAQLLNKKSGQAKLNIANRIFVSSDFQLQSDFNRRSQNYFHSGAQSVNFKDSPLEAIDIINKWVENETNDKINNLMQPGSVDSDTAAVIVNAIYFKGKWQEPFSKSSTHKSAFWISENDSVDVDTMFGNDRHLKYGEFPELNATAIEMPYKDSDISMMLILPSQKEGLADLESKLSSMDINELSSKMTTKKVDLRIPKFRIEFSTGLSNALKQMGIRSMFENADLSGIFQSRQSVKVSDAQHKALIDVNEAGSEAAAASFLTIQLMSFDPNMKFFNVNRPFFFAIKDSNAVYFAGHVAKL